ncbi:lysM domain receptor-like kinase 3 [Impatiens glandulifera]|uniref:lysM domain receptor-like kinase 3 n=1 Tax=Impatiens glandulifera TaxID=253017 RepID=UPI001FB1913D|nr:lysM domain receptor-like kinase 3 [Impatiens glandulifera]
MSARFLSTSSMCKTKKNTGVVESKSPRNSIVSPSSEQFDSSSSRRTGFVPYRQTSGDRFNSTSTTASSSYNHKDTRSSISSRTSLSSLRDSLPENARVYDFSEIRQATNNFSAKPFSNSSSSTSWRCLIGGKDVIVFQRKLRQPITKAEELSDRLSLICKSSHASLIKLHGASLSGNYIYLVYDYIHGGNLTDCLRNPRNPNFTVLSNWMSRMQIAADLAHGFDYLHNSTGLSNGFVHNHIKTSSIIINEPGLNAKICHFGTAELCGEVDREDEGEEESGKIGRLKRYGSGMMKFGGARGYMSPEYLTTGIPTQKSDIFAFGVVVLEIVSGKEPLKYVVSDGEGYMRVSLIDTAREAVADGGGGVRGWADSRLRDSYPVEVAEKMVRVGLNCIEDDPNDRPGMGMIANWISKLYLESEVWVKNMGFPTDFTVSLTGR